MVVVAQLAERWLVVPDVAGSSPVFHQKEEQKMALICFICKKRKAMRHAYICLTCYRNTVGKDAQ